MEALKSISKSVHIGEDGLLKLKMPPEVAGQQVDIVLSYIVKDEPQQESWHDFVNRTYGMFADEPIERAPQPPMQEREWPE